MPHIFGHTQEDDGTFGAEDQDSPPGTEWKSDIFWGTVGGQIADFPGGGGETEWTPNLAAIRVYVMC